MIMDDFGTDIVLARTNEGTYNSLLHWYFSNDGITQFITINAGCFSEWN
jgi:hypothetical protein